MYQYPYLMVILVCITGCATSISLLDQLLPSGEWQVNKSLAECNEYLFRHKVAADVTFMVSYKDGPSRGTPVSFRAHRLLLLARSPVFFDMFHVNTSLSHPLEIEVTDVDPDAFNEMLRFIYYDEAEIVAENVQYVLQAAKKYKLTNLALKCSEFLEEMLDASNVFGILEHSLFFKDQRLIDKALNLIRDNGKAALSSAAFSKLSQKAIGQVIDMYVKNAREIDIFNACMTWAWAECDRQNLEKNSTNARLVLGNHLYKIRFPTMSLTEFANQVVPVGVLSTEEGYRVYQYLICTTKPDNMSFPVEHRSMKDLLILTNLHTKSIEPNYNISKTITIEVDKNIKITEFYFHGLHNDAPNPYRHVNSVTISIRITQNDNLLLRTSIKEAASEHKKFKSKYPFVTISARDSLCVQKGTFTIQASYETCCAADNVNFLSIWPDAPLIKFSDESLSISVWFGDISSSGDPHAGWWFGGNDYDDYDYDYGDDELDLPAERNFPFLGFKYMTDSNV